MREMINEGLNEKIHGHGHGHGYGRQPTKSCSIQIFLFFDDCIYDLKNDIKEAKSPMFDHIPADEIQLSRVSVNDNPSWKPLTIT